jgi:hypothetical protein
MDNSEEINRIVIHTETMVKGFFGEYRWLSNYHVCPVIFRGMEFTSSEAAYQSAKTNDDYVKSQIQAMSPSESKKFSHSLKTGREWEKTKKGIMYEILVDKYTRNEDLKRKLLETGSKYLEETNYWDDTYWGVYMGKGKNTLGELLMKIRNELKLQETWIEKL